MEEKTIIQRDEYVVNPRRREYLTLMKIERTGVELGTICLGL
jgi:hypothetical protein